MRCDRMLWLLVLSLLVIVDLRWAPALAAQPAGADGLAVAGPAVDSRAVAGKAPVLFIENVGQFPAAVRYQVWGGSRSLWITDDALWLVVEQPVAASGVLGVLGETVPHTGVDRRGIALRLRFEQTSPSARLEPLARHDSHISYLLGNDPAGWHPDIPVWSSIVFRDLYPGLDLEMRGDEGQWHWQWRLGEASGLAALAQARLGVAGADSLVLIDGRLRVTTELGVLEMPLPELATTLGPAPPPTTVDRLSVLAPVGGGGAGGAELRASGAADLRWSTLLGGNQFDSADALARDAAGAIYIAGQAGTGFPTTPGAYDTTYNSGFDAYVTKLSADGSSLLYSTFLGGSQTEIPGALAVDGSGNAIVAGLTYSSNFPVSLFAHDNVFNTPPMVSSYNGHVTKLNATGNGLLFSTFLGGSASHVAAMTVDNLGRVTVAGGTTDSGFPTTAGAYDRVLTGSSDGFVARLDPNGSFLTFSTLLGGSNEENLTALAVDAGGDLYVVGTTTSPTFPVTAGAYDATFNSGQDAFITRLTSNAAGLVFSTFLGGNAIDLATDLAIDAGGDIVVVGATSSTNFPTTPGAYDTSFSSNYDAYVIRLAGSGSTLIFSTLLGGTGSDFFSNVAVDSGGALIIVGNSTSTDFPTTPGSYDTSHNGGADVIVVKLSPTGRSLRYATFVGANGSEGASTLIDFGGGQVIVGGSTTSAAFPTTVGAYDRSYNGSNDGFLIRLSLVDSEVAAAISWYFAEGYTGVGFDEYLTIQNPNSISATVTITYYLASGPPVIKSFSVPPTSRDTIAVHDTSRGVGRDQAVSAKVESTNGVGIVVERPIYFAYSGSMGAVTGGHNVMGATAPHTSWYFAEGYTGAGFDQYLTILNPNTDAADVNITYYLASGAPVVKSFSVPPTSRDTVAVHDGSRGVGRDQAVSAKVESTNGVGIVVERPIYFRYSGSMGAVDGGHNVMGAYLPRQTWYLAEGYTGAGFDEYLTILNPGTVPATVTVTYFLAGGPPATKNIVVPATARYTVAVHEAAEGVGRGQAVAARVTTTAPGGIVVERPMYFAYGGAIRDGHNVIGAETTSQLWLVAEGYTGDGFDQYLTILNPNSADAAVAITYYLAGGSPVTQSLVVPAQARETVAVHGPAPGVGRGQAVSARIASTNGIGVVVERPMYFRYTGSMGGADGGHNVIGYLP